MRPIVVSIEAARDVDRLESWLLDRGAARAGKRLGSLIADAIGTLADTPDRGRIGPRADLRELVVPFGSAAYLIHYRVEPERIVIARIRHSREHR